MCRPGSAAAGTRSPWFATAASLPGLSMDAEKAARRIVRGIRTGRTEIVLTLPAKVGVLLHGLAPATTQTVLSWVNRLLPSPTEPGAAVPGLSLAQDASPLVATLSGINRRAGSRLNQPQPDRE